MIMISSTEIILLLLGLGIFIAFRWRRKPDGKTDSTGQRRLERIQNASFIFSALLWVSLPLSAYWFLGFLFGWPGFSHDPLRMVVSHHVYASPAEMPPAVFWLMIIKQGLTFFAGGMLLRLFWLYGKGIIFSARNVNCIRSQGYCLIIDWFINYQLQSLTHDMELSTTSLFVGLLIIFIAWIMDEGRKIQEEQELTV